MGKSRPCILAEEMPAPNTVKKTRTVFEQMFMKNTPVPASTATTNGNSSPDFGNKTISSIKSNPTSKIFRSESMRDGGLNRLGISVSKPILSKAKSVDPTSGPPRPFEFRRRGSKPTALEERLGAARAEVSHSRFLQEHEAAEDEEDDLASLSSTITSTEEEPKLISPDVLTRIRSLGTTTTYFGGEIVAKTVKNRKLAVPPPKKIKSFEDEFEPVEFVSDEIYYSARPSSGTSPDFRPLDYNNIYSSRQRQSDSTPRIISVLPKSPSNSPTKSNSPVGSLLIEGRNSPEGCESQPSPHSNPSEVEWISEKMTEDSNNNKTGSKSFSAAAEGAWF